MKRDVPALQEGPFDLLVVGGGIYGAWTAFDAALHGYRVALIDKGDWASGTSSSSSKLIHGGLRYLEQYNFRLVRHALEERRILKRIAPYQIDPVRFVIPVYDGDRVGRRMIKLGLSLYDRLAGGNQPVAPHQSFDADELAARYPYLKSDGLKGGFTYGDCQEDDARLALEVVDSAQRAGAAAANYVIADELLVEKGRATGAKVTDRMSGESFEIRANVTVSATGPWARDLLGQKLKHTTPVRRIKGVHIVMPALPEPREAFLVTARSDGRVMFVIPWYDHTLIGTTEAEFKGDPDTLRVTPAETSYLLEECNRALDVNWRPDDILGCYAGVRTLIMDTEATANAASREFTITQPAEGLFLPIGGKYTTARRDASQVLDKAKKLLGEAPVSASSKKVPLAWSPTTDYDDWLRRMRGKCVGLGMDERTAFWCVKRHGTGIEMILDRIRKDRSLANRIAQSLPFCRAEVVHAVSDEMAVSLTDILRRRIPVLLLRRADDALVDDVLKLAGDELGWSKKERASRRERFLAEWRDGLGQALPAGD